MKYFERIGSGDAFRRMCILDALILNTDRHSGNFGVLYQNDTMQVQKMAPVFDNNQSLLFDLDDDQLENTEWSIRHCSPPTGRGFYRHGQRLNDRCHPQRFKESTRLSF